MKTKEFSQQFDLLLSSFKDFNTYGLTIGQVLSLNEYEKSMYLTMAQEAIVLELVSGKNGFRDSFEKTEEVRRYLQPLVREYSINRSTSMTYTGVSSYSQFFSLEDLRIDNIWYIIFEKATLVSNRITEVKPVSHNDVYRTLQNPFRSNFNRITLRLDVSDYSDKVIELINSTNIKSYYFRYLKKPNPIILEDFDEVSIDGIKNITECELHETLHASILGRAYEMALQAYVTARGTVPAREQKENNTNKN